MAVKLGINVYIDVSDDDITFVKLAKQDSSTLNLTHAPADITNKDSNQWTEDLRAFNSWEATASGVFDETDVAYLLCETAWRDKTVFYVTMQDGTREHSGECTVTAINITAPKDDAARYDITFKGSGVLATV